MVSATPPVETATQPLPRRDIIAICAFLNRKGERVTADCDLPLHAEGILQQLADAARMQ